MLPALQFNLLHHVLRLPKDPGNQAWDVAAVVAICSMYGPKDQLSGRQNGWKPFHRYLVEPKIVSISPDGRWCKMTDYGMAVFQGTEASQSGWEETPIIALNDAEKNQIIIKPGETFRAKFFVIQLFRRAHAIIRLQDNYCAAELLEWLYSIFPKTAVRLLTSPRTTKQDPIFQSLYYALNKERPSSEVRVTQDIHDREIIIDDREAFQIGESIKDLGNKGTTITRLENVAQHISQFDELWSASKQL